MTRRSVAMACLKLEQSIESRERFIREAHLTASLEHPNIMPVYDTGIDEEGAPFFTMKLIKGDDLDMLIKKHRPKLDQWSIIERLSIFTAICEGMSYAHSHNILHLDLKPANIHIGEFGEVLICDWGLGKILFNENDQVDTELSIDPLLFNELTLDGDIKGTPGYMAPEQADIQLAPRTVATDIYMLGGILYTLIAGYPPIGGSTPENILDNTISGNIRSFGHSHSIPYALEAVITKALSLQQQDRYTSVNELKEDVVSYINGFATTAEEAGFVRTQYLLLKRHKTTSFLLAVIVAAICIFIVRLRISEQSALHALKLYEMEKEQLTTLSEETAPQLVKLAWVALRTYKFVTAQRLIDQAFKLEPKSKDVREVSACLHFYRQEFRAANKLFSKSKYEKEYPLYTKSLRFGQLKPDSTRLTSEQLIELIKTFKYYNDDLKILMHYERKHKSNHSEYLKAVKAVFQQINPEHSLVNFTVRITKEKKILDLSGNPLVIKPKIELLQGVPLTSLNLEGLRISHYDTKFLSSMALEEVNLNVPTPLNLHSLHQCENLKRVILRKNAYSEKQLDALRKKMDVILK